MAEVAQCPCAVPADRRETAFDAERPDLTLATTTPERVSGRGGMAHGVPGGGRPETAPRPARLLAPFILPNYRFDGQDDEVKRRRITSELGCSGGGADEAAADSPAGACSTSSSATNLSEADPQPLSRGVETTLRTYLASWAQRLVQLQPKVRTGGTHGTAKRDVALWPPACLTRPP